MVAPWHTVVRPEIAPAFTVSRTAMARKEISVPQILEIEYETDAVPPVRPETTPMPFTVATNGVVVDQVPPEAPLDTRLTLDPAHTLSAPVTMPALGMAFTEMDTVVVLLPHRFVAVYVIKEVPAATVVTKPEAALTVATVGVVVLHTPVPVAVGLVSVTMPGHTEVGATIAPADAGPVTVTVAVAVPAVPAL